MKWAIRIGSYRGIPVYLHLTFLLLIAFVAWAHWDEGQTSDHAITGVLFTLAIFGCVLLHEFGHALMAQRYGIRTRDITLLPIGGVARLEKMPEDPRQELLVAIAGPAVNVVIAGALFLWLTLSETFQPLDTLGVTQGSFLERLMLINLLLVGFNLIPAFPMDGGRVLRALLALRLDYVKATNIAAALGQGLAFVFGFLGFFYNPFLIFIAFFVYIGAAQESAMATMRAAFEGIPVRSAMITDFKTLRPTDRLADAIQLVIATSQQDFPVVEADRLAGILTADRLMIALAEHGKEHPVAEVMEREFQEVDPSEMLQSALARLQTCDCHAMPVARGGQILGLLTMENIGELVRINTALRRAAELARA